MLTRTKLAAALATIFSKRSSAEMLVEMRSGATELGDFTNKSNASNRLSPVAPQKIYYTDIFNSPLSRPTLGTSKPIIPIGSWLDGSNDPLLSLSDLNQLQSIEPENAPKENEMPTSIMNQEKKELVTALNTYIQANPNEKTLIDAVDKLLGGSELTDTERELFRSVKLQTALNEHRNTLESVLYSKNKDKTDVFSFLTSDELEALKKTVSEAKVRYSAPLSKSEVDPKNTDSKGRVDGVTLVNRASDLIVTLDSMIADMQSSIAQRHQPPSTEEKNPPRKTSSFEEVLKQATKNNTQLIEKVAQLESEKLELIQQSQKFEQQAQDAKNHLSSIKEESKQMSLLLDVKERALADLQTQINSLSQQGVEDQTQLKALTEALAEQSTAYQKEKEDLGAKLTANEVEQQRLELQINQLSTERLSATEEVNKLAKEYKQLESQLSLELTKKGALSESNNELTAQLQKLKTDITGYQSNLQKLVKEGVSQSAELTALRTENASLLSSQKTDRDRWRALLIEQTDLKAQVETLTATNKTLSEDVSRAKQLSEHFQSVSNQWRDKSKNFEQQAQDAKSHLSSIKEESKQMSLLLDVKERALADLQTQINSLSQQGVEDQTQLKALTEALAEQSTAYQKEKEDLGAKLTANEAQQKELELQIDQLSADRLSATEEVNKLAKEYKQLESQLTLELTNKGALAESNNELTAQLQKLKNDIRGYQSNLQKLVTEGASQSEKLTALRTENASLLSSQKTDRDRWGDMLNQHGKLTEQVRDLTAENEKLSRERYQFERDAKKFKIQCDRWLAEANKQRGLFKNISEEFAVVKGESERLSAAAQVKEKEINDLRVEIESMTSQSDQDKAELDKLKSELADKIKVYEQDKVELNKNLAENEASSQKLQDELSKLSKEKNDVLANISKLNAEVKRLEGSHKDLVSQLSSKSTHNKDLEVQLEKSRENIEGLNKELAKAMSSLNEQVNNLNSQVADLEKTNKNLRFNLQNEQFKYEMYKERDVAKNAQAVVKAVNIAIHEEQKKRTPLNEKIKEQDTIVRNLGTALKDSEERVTKLQQESTRLFANIKQLESEHQQQLSKKDGANQKELEKIQEAYRNKIRPWIDKSVKNTKEIESLKQVIEESQIALDSSQKNTVKLQAELTQSVKDVQNLQKQLDINQNISAAEKEELSSALKVQKQVAENTLLNLQKLGDEGKKLTKRYNDLVGDHQSLQNDNKTLLDQVSLLTSQVNTQTEEIEKLRLSLNIKQELHEAVRKRDQIKQAEQNLKYQNISEHAQGVQKKNAFLATQNDDLQKNIATHVSTIASQVDSINQLSSSLEETKTKLLQSQKEVKSLTKQSVILAQTIKTQQDHAKASAADRGALEKEHADQMISLNKKLEENRGLIDKLNGTIISLQNDLTSGVESLATVKEELKLSEERGDALVTLVKTLQDDQADLKFENAELLFNLAASQKKIDVAQSEVEKLQEGQALLQTQLKTLANENSDLKAKNDVLSSEVKSLNVQVASLTKQVTQLTTSIREQTQKNITLYGQLENKEKALNASRQTVDDLKSKIERLQQDHTHALSNATKQQKKQLTAQHNLAMAELRGEIQQLEGDIQSLKSQIQESQAEASLAQSALINSQNECILLQERIANMETISAKDKVDFEVALKDQTQLVANGLIENKKLSEKQDLLQKAFDDLDKQNKALKKENEDLVEKVTGLTKQIGSLEVMVRFANFKSESLTEQCDRLTQECASSAAKLEEVKAEKEELVIKLREVDTLTKTELAEITAKLSEAEMSIESFTEKNKSLLIQLEQSQLELDDTRRELRELGSEHRSLQLALNTSEFESKANKKEIQELKTELGELEQQLKETDVVNTRLNNDLAEVNTKNKETSQELAELKGEYQRLIVTNETLLQRVSELETILANANNSNLSMTQPLLDVGVGNMNQALNNSIYVPPTSVLNSAANASAGVSNVTELPRVLNLNSGQQFGQQFEQNVANRSPKNKWEKIHSSDKNQYVISNTPKETIELAINMNATWTESGYDITEKQKNELATGTKVYSNTGIPFTISQNDDGTVKAVLQSGHLESTDKDDPKTRNMRIAVTVIDMINEVLSKGEIVNFQTKDTFKAAIADKYLKYLESINSDIFNQESSFIQLRGVEFDAAKKDDKKLLVAEEIFGKIATSPRYKEENIIKSSWYTEAAGRLEDAKVLGESSLSANTSGTTTKEPSPDPTPSSTPRSP